MQQTLYTYTFSYRISKGPVQMPCVQKHQGQATDYILYGQHIEEELISPVYGPIGSTEKDAAVGGMLR